MRWLFFRGLIQRAQLLGPNSPSARLHKWTRQLVHCCKLPSTRLSVANSCKSVAVSVQGTSQLAARHTGLWRSIQLLGGLGRCRVSGLVGVAAVTYTCWRLSLNVTNATTALCHKAVAPDFEGSELQVAVDFLSPGNQIGLFHKFYLAFRLVYLSVLFFPVVFLYGLGSLLNAPYLSDLSWRYMLVAIQIAGPAFIKLGQWASTRRDLFSEAFCSTLSRLHTRCEPHSWENTVETLEESFGREWRDRIVIVDMEPIGSGCVAQVYKGHLKLEGAGRGGLRTNACPATIADSSTKGDTLALETGHLPSSAVPPPCSEPSASPGTEVCSTSDLEGKGGPAFVPIAVKVLHPGIVDQMERDICVMKYAAEWVDYIYPDVHWVALKECVNEFSQVMWKQLDLKQEARNLLRFRRLLHDYPNVKFPVPIQPFVTNSVLVESFEQGTLISNYLDKPGGRLQKTIARIGIEVLLDMLFIHNLVHGDLHPGNILVQNPKAVEDEPTLILLDCGIATSLSPLDLANFRAVFTAIVKGEGAKVADMLLGTQQCTTREEYTRSMAELVETGRMHLNLKETDVGDLFSKLFNILIEHKVRIEPQYTCVMVAMMVIEGLGRALDPTLDILAAAKPVLLRKVKQTFRQNLQSYCHGLNLDNH